MSSDSEDDYSYTNSVSVLKALTQKDMSIDSDIDTSKHGINFFDSSEIESPVLPIQLRKRIEQQTTKLTNEEWEPINLDDVDIDSTANDSNMKVTKNNNDSLVVLSDEELERAPVNIISAIDDVLQNQNKKVRRKRGKQKTTSRQTRQSKRFKKAGKVLQNDSLLNSSIDVCIVEDTPDDINEINYEVTVKVYWKSQNLEKFTMRRFDKLTNIFKYFSEKENISENRLLFTIKDKIISKNDTLNGLNITAATIIEGGILSGNTDLVESKSQDDHTVEFKVQTRDRKRPLLISLKPEDKMEVLMYQCSQELDIPMKSLKFYFDGDLIKPSNTPETLDLEGGEIIDCIRI